MSRIMLGALGALFLTGLGLFWWQGRAEVERGAPPPDPLGSAAVAVQALEKTEEPQLPTVETVNMVGPAPPEASELSREQRRFFRYDRNRNWKISRAEMLSSRTDAFRKLDVDGNNLLTFEEWAVATANRFDKADANRDRDLTPSEFATTRPKKRAKPACKC